MLESIGSILLTIILPVFILIGVGGLLDKLVGIPFRALPRPSHHWAGVEGGLFLLFIVNLLESSRDQRLTLESWEGFQWRLFLGRIRRVLDLKLIAFAGGLFALMVAVSSLIFVVMPRFRFDQAIPFLQMKTSSLTGFSDSIELGGVTDIVEDNRVALRLDAPSREAIPINPYFRMLVLDYYSDGNFSLSRSVKQRPRWLKNYERHYLNLPLVVWLPRSEEGDLPGAENNTWTFYLEGGISKFLPILGPFQIMRFQKIQEFEINEAFLAVNLDSATNSVFSYQVFRMQPTDSLAANPFEKKFFAEARPLLASRESGLLRDLEYPQSLLAVPLEDRDTRYVRNVVGEITGGEDLGWEEFSERTIAYLHRNHSYSLSSNVRDRGRDQVVAWLEDGHDGHCEYFAGAFTILARAAGFPTRVVVGFNGGSWNPVEEYFVVRNRNAHAWCEVYDGKGSWHRVDPTPSAQRFLETGLAGNMRDLPEIGGWEGWVDSLRILWYRSIVNFDDQSQEALATRLRNFGKEFGVEMKNTAVAWGEAIRDWLRQPFTWQRGLQLAGLAVAGVLLYLLFLQRFAIRRWLMGTAWGRKLVGGRPDPVRRKAGRLLQRYSLAMDRVDRNADLWASTSEYKSTLIELQSLRFGDLSNREEAPRIFRDARGLIRQASRS